MAQFTLLFRDSDFHLFPLNRPHIARSLMIVPFHLQEAHHT
jgi:hypothetical protein